MLGKCASITARDSTIMYQWVNPHSYRLDAALDLEYDITNLYTGSYFEQEISGLAAASGVDEKTIRRIHMIGELTYVETITLLYKLSSLI